MDRRAEPALDQVAALSDLRQRHTLTRQDFHATHSATPVPRATPTEPPAYPVIGRSARQAGSAGCHVP
jgi:hypothetical protein